MRVSMKRTIGAVLFLIVGLAAIKGFQISRAIAANSSHIPPPEAITTSIAEKVVWPDVIEVVGSLVPERGALLSVEEPGTVARVLFESGVTVAEGSPLIELDTSVEAANLAGAKARRERARKDLDRASQLRSNKTVSAQALDLAEAEFREADASVVAIEAAIARKRVVAPFDGITGIRNVNVGDYLVSGTPVVSLQSLDRMYVNFAIPQKRVNDVRVGQKVEISVDTYPGRMFQGVVNAFDPQVNSSTRNVSVQATISNTERYLRPGMFVEVRLVLDGSQELIALPSTSIAYAPYGDTVYVVDTMKGEDGVEVKSVRQQVVRVGPKRGDQVAILDGVTVGQEVATSGLFKLRPGAAVSVNNSLSPGNEITPEVADT